MLVTVVHLCLQLVVMSMWSNQVELFRNQVGYNGNLHLIKWVFFMRNSVKSYIYSVFLKISSPLTIGIPKNEKELEQNAGFWLFSPYFVSYLHKLENWFFSSIKSDVGFRAHLIYKHFISGDEQKQVTLVGIHTGGDGCAAAQLARNLSPKWYIKVIIPLYYT